MPDPTPKKLNKNLALFLIGLTDSVSLYWVRKILLVTHPTTKKIHPSSLQLLATFKNTFIQVFVFMIGLPYMFRYFNQDFIATLLSTFFLLLTYGYLFFYNTDIMVATKKVALWSAKFPKTNFCEFDNRQKVQLFYSLSNQLKSFIFLLLYYTPIFLTCLLLISYFPYLGTTLLLISQSFFNSIFYFLKKWPYDTFNIGFIEKYYAYMLGYGFFVSFVCNVCLSGDLSRGAYFVISQWMIINCLLHSPPEIGEDGIEGRALWKCLISSKERSSLPNAYNIHRRNIRADKKYRDKLLNSIKLLKPALMITQFLNSLLARRLGHQIDKQISANTDQTPTQQQQNKQEQARAGLEIVSQTYEPEEDAAQQITPK